MSEGRANALKMEKPTPTYVLTRGLYSAVDESRPVTRRTPGYISTSGPTSAVAIGSPSYGIAQGAV